MGSLTSPEMDRPFGILTKIRNGHHTPNCTHRFQLQRLSTLCFIVTKLILLLYIYIYCMFMKGCLIFVLICDNHMRALLSKSHEASLRSCLHLSLSVPEPTCRKRRQKWDICHFHSILSFCHEKGSSFDRPQDAHRSQ